MTTKYIINKRQRIPKGQSEKDNNPKEPETQGTQDEEKQKHNIICVGQYYTQTNYVTL